MILNKLNVKDSYSRDIISAPYDDDPWQMVAQLRENQKLLFSSGQ